MSNGKPLEGEALVEAGLYWIRLQQLTRWNIGEAYKPELVKGSGKEDDGQEG